MNYNRTCDFINANIGTTHDNMSSPVHNWYKFTAVFSYKFIDEIIDKSSTSIGCIYEPFAGCGTTLVEAQKKGVYSIGNESQQLMCDIINAKLNWDVNPAKCLECLNRLEDYVNAKIGLGITEKECHPLLTTLYDAKTLDILYLIRDAIEDINDNKYRLFFAYSITSLRQVH